MSRREVARAFAPASVANLASGFDLLGHTLGCGLGDEGSVRRISEPTVRIAGIEGTGEILPFESHRNTAGAALLALRRQLGLDFGFELTLRKGVPVSSGLGGSASSCVAALLAANSLLDSPLSREALYPLAQLGEAAASGVPRGDNVGACLWGAWSWPPRIGSCRSGHVANSGAPLFDPIASSKRALRAPFSKRLTRLTISCASNSISLCS